MSASAPRPKQRSFLLLRERYILRQLFLGLAGITSGAIALIWLMQSLRFVSLVVDRGLSLRVFLQLTSLMIPSFLAVILPITTFLVILFGYQRMSGDRELTVMQAAGLSPFQLARPAVACALIATVLGYILNLWLVPVSYHAFRRYEFEIRNRMAAFLLQDGVFAQLSKDMTVYVRKRDRDGVMHGVFVEDDRQPTARATIIAERGTMVVVDNQPRVVLFNGSRQEIDHHTGRLNVLTFDRNSIDLSSSKQATTEVRDASEMSLPELFHPDPRLVSQRDWGKFAVEGWRRLTSPLTTLSFGMIALVAVLSGAFSRHGNIKRPLAAILSVVGLMAMSLMLQNLAGRNLALVPMLWAVAILPAIGCAVWLFAPRGIVAGRKTTHGA